MCFDIPSQIAGFDMRPLVRTDEALMKRWIASPEWQRYWGTPEKEWGEVVSGIDDGSAFGFIFGQGDRDIGWIQYWGYGESRDYAADIGVDYLDHFGDDAIGMDISIGDPSNQNRGIGSRILAAMAQLLTAQGANVITIDPDRQNMRAIAAYHNAGFTFIGQYGDIHLMQWGAEPSMGSHT